MDEASHGMCTHRCTKEEIAAVCALLQDAAPDRWKYIGGLKDVAVTEEAKTGVLRMLREYLETDQI